MDKKVESVISALEKQFNGDEAHDMDIVRQYLATLDRSEENIDIVREIGKYCTEKFPNSEAVKNARQLEEAFNTFRTKIIEIQESMKVRNFERAVSLLREVIGESVPAPIEGKKRFCFDHPFEEMIWRANSHDETPLERLSTLPMVLYYQLGSSLFELKDYDAAREAYEHALELNPVNTLVYFELIQIAKAREDYQEVRNILAKIHSYLYSRHQLARFYREHAGLAMIEGKYDLAATLVYLSIDYEDTPVARAQLNALAKHRGTDLNKPNVDLLKARLENAHIPVGPSSLVYQTALQIGEMTRHQYPQISKMAFGIAYDITHYRPLLKEL
ncbi:MAG: tetratricopeptide repeat protein [Bradymonadia bacterium]